MTITDDSLSNELERELLDICSGRDVSQLWQETVMMLVAEQGQLHRPRNSSSCFMEAAFGKIGCSGICPLELPSTGQTVEHCVNAQIDTAALEGIVAQAWASPFSLLGLGSGRLLRRAAGARLRDVQRRNG